MKSNMEEALRAKAFAEKHFIDKDIVGANNYALRAQVLCPQLEGISQMVATFAIYIASEAKINGELDFYSILGLDPSTDRPKLKRRYKKMAILLHPDKNKTVGADGAFQLVFEAWSLLSDKAKRNSYDQRRNSFYCAGPGFHGRSDTFWTVCTSCHVQYEYLRKYVNKRLSCKNCRGVFIAVETCLAPVSNSFPYCTTYSYGSDTAYGTHSHGVTYVPPTTGLSKPSGVSGHRNEFASSISFQSNLTGNSAAVMDHKGLSASSFVFSQANGDSSKTNDGDFNKVSGLGNLSSNGYTSRSEAPKPKRGRPSKKRKVDLETLFVNGDESSQNIIMETRIVNGNGTLQPCSKLSSPSENRSKRWSTSAAFDARQFLVNKAKSEIRTKLDELKLASEMAAKEVEMRKAYANVDKVSVAAKLSGASGAGNQIELKRTVSVSITVPDSDFHDFDQDRLEECFKSKQIWALYDEEDGMPRLYCLIREIISVNPFKIFISYLSSKSDTEFGSVNWLDSGFTKSCGSFRVFHSETIDQVNIFSHALTKEKAGRGGLVRIYPRRGDIWAVYRNWSPDWNRSTLDEVRHRYEMVEVLEDYSEENGVWVTPLIKLDGFKTVYQRNTNNNAVRWISRREMLRFSHQVPACSLKVEGANLPDGCWDLDPAATPDELLLKEHEIRNNESPVQTQKTDKNLDPAATPDELLLKENEIRNSQSPVQAQKTEIIQDEEFEAEMKAECETKIGQNQMFESIPLFGVKVCAQENPFMEVAAEVKYTE